MELNLDTVKKFSYKEYCNYNNLNFLEKEKIKLNIFLKKISDNIFNKLEGVFNFKGKFLNENIKNEEILFYKIEKGIKEIKELTENEKKVIIERGTILSKIKLVQYNNGSEINSFL